MTATQIPLVGTAVVIGYNAAEIADAVFGNRLEHINIAHTHTHTSGQLLHIPMHLLGMDCPDPLVSTRNTMTALS